MKLLILLSVVALAAAKPRIIGGTEAERGEFPHQGSFQVNSQHVCGCALIDAKWALTAAHCAYDRDPSIISLLLGAHDRLFEGTRYGIVDYTIHPDFEGGSPWPNDIALIEIAESVDLSDEYVDVVSISSHGVDYPFSGCVISGWGHETGGGWLADKLQRADTDVITQDECREHWTGEDQIRDSHVCVYDTENQETGACNGDSGGPLTCDEGLVGVTSWGPSGCDPIYPSVYCRVGLYCDWIAELTAGDVTCT